MNTNKFKLILSIFFLALGLACAIITFDLKSSYHTETNVQRRGPYADLVETKNDQVAIGLGIISGFSFLSSVLLLNSLKE
ncbi:MAG: hypothetical protein A2V93_03920 [Ignavibacteria bacterium RBG_16_34_14]|nr:MAG: hypothetical protein A2V93_03920 [Ignavibacteria bacterium RBG_16_34_14]